MDAFNISDYTNCIDNMIMSNSHPTAKEKIYSYLDYLYDLSKLYDRDTYDSFQKLISSLRTYAYKKLYNVI